MTKSELLKEASKFLSETWDLRCDEDPKLKPRESFPTVKQITFTELEGGDTNKATFEMLNGKHTFVVGVVYDAPSDEPAWKVVQGTEGLDEDDNYFVSEFMDCFVAIVRTRSLSFAKWNALPN